MLLGKPEPKDTSLHPMQHKWAYELYNQAVRNTWFPHEIPLGEDIKDWNEMTEDERHAVEFLMAFFNPAELIVNRALALGVYPYIKAPTAHLYLAKQMWEEANHCVAFEYVLETFPVNREELYKVHTTTDSMIAKEDFINKYLKRMTEVTLDIESPEGKKDFIRNLIAYSIVMEGIWFYSGFMVVLSFRQRNKLRNFASLINWVIRDESPLPERNSRTQLRLRKPVRAVRSRPPPRRARYAKALQCSKPCKVDVYSNRRVRTRKLLRSPEHCLRGRCTWTLKGGKEGGIGNI